MTDPRVLAAGLVLLCWSSLLTAAQRAVHGAAPAAAQQVLSTAACEAVACEAEDWPASAPDSGCGAAHGGTAGAHGGEAQQAAAAVPEDERGSPTPSDAEHEPFGCEDPRDPVGCAYAPEVMDLLLRFGSEQRPAVL